MYYDIILLHAIQSFSHPILDELMKNLTHLGSPVFWVAVAAIIFWMGKEKKAFELMNLVVFSSMVVGVLKSVFAVPRPEFIQEKFRILETSSPIDFGFPSGHSTMIAAVFAFFASKKKIVLTLLLAIVVIIVGYSRLYLGVHFPSDVLAGIVLGLIIGLINRKISGRIDKAKFKISLLEEEMVIVIAVIASIIILLFFQPLALSAIIIGFYVGFFTLKEAEIPLTQISNTKTLIKKQFFGLIVLGILGALALAYTQVSIIIQFILLFLAGLWISLFYPVFYERMLKQFNA